MILKQGHDDGSKRGGKAWLRETGRSYAKDEDFGGGFGGGLLLGANMGATN
jgi:hypothetical protein